METTLESQESAISMEVSAHAIARIIMDEEDFPSLKCPHSVAPIRGMMAACLHAMGNRYFEPSASKLHPAVHALADAIFDNIFGIKDGKTHEIISKLPVDQRLVVANILYQESILYKDLLNLKATVERICCTAKVSSTESAVAQHRPLIHQVLDIILQSDWVNSREVYLFN